MTHRRRSLSRSLIPLVLALTAGLGLALHEAAAQPDNARVDGYLGWSGGCMVLRQHDGELLSLVGGTEGLRAGDHTRLAGRYVNEQACGVPSFEVMNVETLWGDDNHRSTRYDHLNGEPFSRFAERTGRLHGERWAWRSGEREGEPRYDRYDRYDRDGRYMYHGRSRPVTLVGRLYESGNGCPMLRTNYTTFALDGDLRAYQSGDAVRITGTLYDGDPNAPCGRPTVVLSGIRGH